VPDTKVLTPDDRRRVLYDNAVALATPTPA
jgi:hypothetical protein